MYCPSVTVSRGRGNGLTEDGAGEDIDDDDGAAFARKVAAFLEDSRRQHRFDRLRLAVEPRFLNVLRAHLSADTRTLVYEDTTDDASHDLRHGLGRR